MGRASPREDGAKLSATAREPPPEWPRKTQSSPKTLTCRSSQIDLDVQWTLVLASRDLRRYRLADRDDHETRLRIWLAKIRRSYRGRVPALMAFLPGCRIHLIGSLPTRWRRSPSSQLGCQPKTRCTMSIDSKPQGRRSVGRVAHHDSNCTGVWCQTHDIEGVD